MTEIPKEELERIEKEAAEEYPHQEDISGMYNDLQDASRDGYIAARRKAFEEVSHLQGRIAEKDKEVEKWKERELIMQENFNREREDFNKSQKELSEARGRIEKLEAGWVSVEERRPEIATKILICSESTRHPYLSGVFSGFRANGGWYLYYDNGKAYVYNDDEHIRITAWMPLPEPPKEPTHEA